MVSDPRAAIEAKLGPLASFEIVGQSESAKGDGREAFVSIGDRIKAALANGALSRDELRGKLKRHVSGAKQLAEEIASLVEAGEIAEELRATGKRPSIHYHLAEIAGPERAPAAVPEPVDLPTVTICDAFFVESEDGETAIAGLHLKVEWKTETNGDSSGEQ
jgi:hypothetical protein